MGLVEDIIGIKGAIEGEWQAIYDTSQNINTLIKDALAWLEHADHVSAVWSDIEDAATIFIATLEALDMSMIEHTMENAKSAIANEFDPVLTKISSIENALNPEQAIATLFANYPVFPKIPVNPLPKVVQELEVLSAAKFKSIFQTIFDGEFSVALKKTRAATAPVQGGATQEQGQNEAIASGLEEMLFSAYESQFETWLESIDVNTIKTNIEQRVSSEQIAALKTNLTNTYVAIKNAPQITLEVILDQLKLFIKNELEDVKSILKEVVTNLRSDLSGIKAHLDTLLSYSADVDSDFTKLYQELFTYQGKVPAPPTLYEAISFVIAIPITLSSQAITGTNFPSLQPAYLSSFDGTAKSKMSGSLKVADLIISVAQKAYGYYRDKHDLPPPDYKYKIAMGLLSSIQSVLSQVAFLPSHYSLEKHYKDNLLWYLGWGTGFGFSAMKWIMDAHETHQKAKVDRASVFRDEVYSFYNTFQQRLTDLNNEYDIIQVGSNGQIKPSSDYEKVIASFDTALSNLVSGIKTLPKNKNEFDAYLKEFQNTEYQGDVAERDLASMNAAIKANLSSKNLKKFQVNINALGPLIAEFNEMSEEFKSLKSFAKDIAPDAYNAHLNHTIEGKFLNEVCPIIDMVITLASLGFKIYVYESEKDKDPQSLALVVTMAFSSVASDLMGLYYTFNPPQAGSPEEKNKKQIENRKFAFDKLIEITATAKAWYMSVNISKASYSNISGSSSAELLVNFNYDVTNNNTKTLNDTFTLTSSTAGVTIPEFTVSKESDSEYKLTLAGELTLGDYTVGVASGVFNDPWGHAVVASKTFSATVGISGVSYDSTSLKVTVTFDDDVTKKNSPSNGYFILSNNGNVINESNISGSGDTYSFKLNTSLTDGTCGLSIGAGAFEDSSGNGVTSFFSFKVPS